MLTANCYILRVNGFFSPQSSQRPEAQGKQRTQRLSRLELMVHTEASVVCFGLRLNLHLPTQKLYLVM